MQLREDNYELRSMGREFDPIAFVRAFKAQEYEGSDYLF